MSADSLRTAGLWGDAHHRLGQAAVVPLGRDLAVGLSCGRFPKPRLPLDPNEDGVLAAAAAGRAVLAVADGHHGFDAADAALGAVQERLPLLLWETDDITGALQLTAEAAGRAVRAALDDLDGDRAGSRTALSVVVIAGSRLYAFGFGDTLVVRLPRRGKAQVVGEPTPFLGPERTGREIVRAALRSRDHVLVLSDGYSGALGPDWLDDLARDGAAERDAAAAVRLLLGAALGAGASDNVALAVWTGP